MVVGAGRALIIGGVVSSTFIICEAVEVLPQASVAVHVLVIVNALAHAPGVVTTAKVNLGSATQLSVAVGVSHVGVTSHSMVVDAGRALISVGVVYSTFIICEAVDVLPQASVAVHVLTIV
jgi:hypothetical protein